MATQSTVRRICLSLPGTIEGKQRFAFSVLNKGKERGYAWVWMERIDPKKPRVPQPKVLAVRTANLEDREFLLRVNTRKYFTEPHYNGFPAVLVRLAKITLPVLRRVITEAWRCMAPPNLVAAHDASEVPAKARTARRARRARPASPGNSPTARRTPSDGRAARPRSAKPSPNGKG